MKPKFRQGQFVEYYCDAVSNMQAHRGHNGSIGLVTRVIWFEPEDLLPQWSCKDLHRYKVQWLIRMDTNSGDQLSSDLEHGYPESLLRAAPMEKRRRK